MPKKLDFETTNCWDAYAAPEDKQNMDALAAGYISFLSTCKTERQAVAYAVEKAKTAGFSEDFSRDAVFRVFRDKTVFFARRGKKPLSEGVRLIGAHVDCPRLDFKQHPLYECCEIGQAKTHYYGGIRKHQWFARPLALHGVAVKKDGQVVHISIGEDLDDPVFTVLDLLPHLAYEQAEKKLAKAFEAEKMNIVLGHEPSPKGRSKGKSKKKDSIKLSMLEMLHEKYGLIEEDLFSAEIQAVPAGPARYVGLDKSLIGGYGHDDRACVYAALEALLTSDTPEHAQVLILWDKEEIGSDGATGAKSLFMEMCMEDLAAAWAPETNARRILMETKAISGDVHPALDPDYQEVHEKLNAALMGHGPSFCKFTGHRGKYSANDAHPEYVAWLRNLLSKHKIPWQMAELGKVDLGGGGTVAKHLAVYGMDIIDCGTPVLSMHSPFELIGKADFYATVLAYRAFLES